MVYIFSSFKFSHVINYIAVNEQSVAFEPIEQNTLRLYKGSAVRLVHGEFRHVSSSQIQFLCAVSAEILEYTLEFQENWKPVL